MTKPIIVAQPSLVISYCKEDSTKLLLSVYDAGYRGGKGPYPMTPNCIGGNPDIEHDEIGPLQVLEREIAEEFDPDYQREHPETNIFNQRVNWASPQNIGFVRDNLLQDLAPWQDFVVNAESFGKGTQTYQAIYSYFVSELPESVFRVVESNLRRQKAIVTEGLVGVFTLDELVYDSRKELSTAHNTAPALNLFFGVDIPYPTQIQSHPIGVPKDSFADYLVDFEYSRVKTPNHNDPTKTDPSFREVLFGVKK
jgi:hypothetical protein